MTFSRLCECACVRQDVARYQRSKCLCRLATPFTADARCRYLCSNTLAPQFRGVELGIGDALLLKTIAQSTGKDNKSLKSAWTELGDLGSVAQKYKGTQKLMFRPKPLTARGV